MTNIDTTSNKNTNHILDNLQSVGRRWLFKTCTPCEMILSQGTAFGKEVDPSNPFNMTGKEFDMAKSGVLAAIIKNHHVLIENCHNHHQRRSFPISFLAGARSNHGKRISRRNSSTHSLILFPVEKISRCKHFQIINCICNKSNDNLYKYLPIKKNIQTHLQRFSRENWLLLLVCGGENSLIVKKTLYIDNASLCNWWQRGQSLIEQFKTIQQHMGLVDCPTRWSLWYWYWDFYVDHT